MSDAQAIQSDNADQAGGIIVSEQFAAEILKEVDDMLFIRQWATIHMVCQSESKELEKEAKNARI